MSFKEEVNALVKTRIPLEERYQAIEDLNERYYQVYQERLPNTLLNRLASWLLVEDYKNTATNKAKCERPILSYHQQRRRSQRLVLMNDENILATMHYHLANHSTARTEKESNL